MLKGEVKWFGGRYGFISAGDGKDIFVHSSDIVGNDYLDEGDKVSFEVTQDDRTGKTKAIKVQVI